MTHIKKKLAPLPIIAFLIISASGCGVTKLGYMPNNDVRETFYVVKRGDTIWRVASATNVSPYELAAFNRLELDSTLYPGQKLILPDGRNKGSAEGTSTKKYKNIDSPKKDEKLAAYRPVKNNNSKANSESKSNVKKASVERRRLEYKPSAPEPEIVDNKTGKNGFSWPLKGVLYAKFGMRDGRHHDGIDISAPEGTPIKAAGDGEVLFSGTHAGYGNLVIIGHGSNLLTIYGHNKENQVKVGDKVSRGDQIAIVGATGRATGPHLHFEVRVGSSPKNPLLYLP